MKEVHSLDPGGRVLTCEHPNTGRGSASERHPWLWAGDGARKEERAKIYALYVSVCMLTYMWTLLYMNMCVNTPVHVRVVRREYSHPWERNDFTGIPTLNTSPPTEQLLIPSAGFLSKVLGTQRLTIHSFSWHITPKPDVPPKSGVVPRSLHQPSSCASFKSCNERKYRLWVETDLGSRPDFVNTDCVTFRGSWAPVTTLAQWRELSPPLRAVM